MSRFKALFITFLMLFALSFGVMAQTDTPEETEVPPDVPSDIGSGSPIEVPAPSEDVPEETVTWLTQIAFASMLVNALVAISNFIPVVNKIPAPQRSLALNLAIWVVFILAQNMGSAETLIAYVTDFGKLADTFMRIVSTYLGGAGIYHAAKASKFPVLGEKQTA